MHGLLLLKAVTNYTEYLGLKGEETQGLGGTWLNNIITKQTLSHGSWSGRTQTEYHFFPRLTLRNRNKSKKLIQELASDILGLQGLSSLYRLSLP